MLSKALRLIPFSSMNWKIHLQLYIYAVYRALLSTNNCVKIYSGTSTVAKGTTAFELAIVLLAVELLRIQDF